MPQSITTTGGEVVIVMNPAQVARLMHDPNEIVVRDILRRAERVKIRAIELAPKKTGKLASHIVKRLGTFDGETAALVGIDGTSVPYARYVHEGAPPHDIYPSRATRLVFFSQKLGKTIFMPPGAPVHHRGNKPNRFLVRALSAAA
jgi:hypothetical protein